MNTSQRRSAAEIYRDYNAAENRHDLAGTTSLVATDLYVEVNGVPQVASGADDEAAMAILYEIYPDYRREIKRIIDSGDEAAVIWRMLGTPSSVIEGKSFYCNDKFCKFNLYSTKCRFFFFCNKRMEFNEFKLYFSIFN